MDTASNENVVREFSGFTVELRQNSRAKKRLSNRLSISVPTDRADVKVSMTIREARALQSFLEENLS